MRHLEDHRRQVLSGLKSLLPSNKYWRNTKEDDQGKKQLKKRFDGISGNTSFLHAIKLSKIQTNVCTYRQISAVTSSFDWIARCDEALLGKNE